MCTLQESLQALNTVKGEFARDICAHIVKPYS